MPKPDPIFIRSQRHRAIVLAEWVPGITRPTWVTYCPGCMSFLGSNRDHEDLAVRVAIHHRAEYGEPLPPELARLARLMMQDGCEPEQSLHLF